MRGAPSDASGAAGRAGRGFGAAFERASSEAVAVLFAVAMAVLAVIAAVNTCFITFDYGPFRDEHTFFVAGSALGNVAALAAVVAVACLTRRTGVAERARKALDNPRRFRLWRRVLLAALLAESLAWVLATLAVPGADQRFLQEAALQAVNGDWSSFAADGYLGKNPHQVGFFWASYALGLVFGKYASAAIQLLNALGIVLTYDSLSKVAAHAGASRVQQLATIAAGIAFYPLVQYCSFAYGVVWGLALAVLGIRLVLDFLAGGSGRWGLALGAAVCLALSVMMKGNNAVFVIAAVLYALMQLAGPRPLRAAGLALLVVAAVGAQSAACTQAAQRASGYDDFGQGVASYAWVAMGLQDGGLRAPGWFNDYNYASYADSGRDQQAQAQMAKEDIAESLAEFARGDRDAVDFFLKKTASQWSNPTFQGYWIVEKRRPAVEVGAFAGSLLEAGAVDAAVRRWLDPLQFCTYALALAWALLAPRRQPRFGRCLVLPLAFVGGFALHLAWEAKAQYALPYFVLLLPYAIRGLALASRAAGRMVDAVRSDGRAAAAVRIRRFARRRAAAIGAGAVGLVLCGALLAVGGWADLRCDDDAYAEWLASSPEVRLTTAEPLAGALSDDRNALDDPSALD